MSELLSALFLIADDGEFRFARFYIVCEEVPLGTPESPPMSPVCRTCTRRIVQTWKRHGIRCKYLAERNALNFSQRIFHPHFHLKSKGMIPSSYFFSRQTGLSAESDSPVFVQSAEAAGLFAGHLLFLLHDHFLDHLAADASGLCGSQVAVVAVL